jgi:WD40 repeat protein
MFGRITFAATLLTLAFLGWVAWETGLGQSAPAAAQEPSKPVAPEAHAASKEATPEPVKAQILAPTAPTAFQDPCEELQGAAEPIVLNSCKVELVQKQDVPSEREGVLLFVGIELKPGESRPAGEQGFPYKGKTYRRLKEGDRVEANELIGIVDPKLAQADFDIKVAKVDSAKADAVASERTRDEAQKRYQTQINLWNGGVRAATNLEDLRGAKLSYDRYIYEVISKKAAIQVADQEKIQAQKVLSMHEIRPKISGIVKSIFKYAGEAVAGANAGRNSEPVALIQNYDLLRVEGAVDIQYAQELRRGMEIVIEPNYRDNPAGTYNAHVREVSGLAVSKDPSNPAIVSGSTDGTVKVWSLESRFPTRIFYPPSPVTALACTPPGAQTNLCLTGCHDGKARIWDLDSKPEKGKREDTPLLELKGSHQGAIRCVAFSPDGKVCATGGEDHEIHLFDTTTGEMLYSAPSNKDAAGHRDTVTSLQFTTQGQLVSASRDDTVRVWNLSAAGAEEAQSPIKRRSCEVAHLGVSRDGKLLLDEHGVEMGVLTLPNRFTWTTFRNPTAMGEAGFNRLALFSPDSRFVLTATGQQGLLQLWSMNKVRSHQVRQFIAGSPSATTAAAFAPSGAFVVAGNQDGKINIWAVPHADEIRKIVGKVSEVEQTVEGTENRVRVVAEFDNTAKRPLRVGELVNMVVYPSKRVGNTVSLLQNGQH